MATIIRCALGAALILCISAAVQAGNVKQLPSADPEIVAEAITCANKAMGLSVEIDLEVRLLPEYWREDVKRRRRKPPPRAVSNMAYAGAATTAYVIDLADVGLIAHEVAHIIQHLRGIDSMSDEAEDEAQRVEEECRRK